MGCGEGCGVGKPPGTAIGGLHSISTIEDCFELVLGGLEVANLDLLSASSLTSPERERSRRSAESLSSSCGFKAPIPEADEDDAMVGAEN